MKKNVWSTFCKMDAVQGKNEWLNSFLFLELSRSTYIMLMGQV